MIKQMKLLKNFFNYFFLDTKSGWKTSMKVSSFTFDCVNLFHYICHKINLNCVGSYIDFPDWIKNKSHQQK